MTMKKILTILMIASVALCAAGCAKETDRNTAEPTAQPGTQLHTIPPTEQIAEPEWAPVDCEISLQNDTLMYADSSGFLTFALTGSADEDCALRFAFDEATTALLAQQAPTDAYITLNGEPLVGTLSFNADYSEATLTGGYTYEEICQLANVIRGFSE